MQSDSALPSSCASFQIGQAPARQQIWLARDPRSRAPSFSTVADQDPSTDAKADPARVPGLLDQYRQQRRAWLAQADELVRMREEVREAAEREAIDIVTAARRDVRRIIVEARRDLLVLTAQLHAAVEATDAPRLEAAPFTALLPDAESRSRAESASHDSDITRDVVFEARKGVRSVLDEARAEIEALSAEAPSVFGHGTPHGSAGHPDVEAEDAEDAHAFAGDDEERAQEAVNDGPVHELSLDDSLAALDFQTRDLPIPTLARILGSAPASDAPSADHASSPGFEPLLAFDTPRLSELRTLLREPVDPIEPADAPPPEPGRTVVLSPEIEPLATSPYAFDAAPRTNFFADRDARATSDDELAAVAGAEVADESATPRFTPPSRLFGEDEPRSPARSARMFVGLFAATGALAVVGTIWWALSRDSAPLSAAAPPVIATDKAATTAPPAAVPAVASTAPGTLALTIEARRPSWIRAQIDGKDETGRIYQAGETRHIYGARSVSIRAGDCRRGVRRRRWRHGPRARPRRLGLHEAVLGERRACRRDDGRRGGLGHQRRGHGAGPQHRARAHRGNDSGRGPSTIAGAGTGTGTSLAAASGAQRGARSRNAARDGVSGGRPDLVQAAQQWLDAYQRRDREAMNVMGTDNVTVSDERSVTERFPAWQGGVQRELDEVALELTGDVAVLHRTHDGAHGRRRRPARVARVAILAASKRTLVRDQRARLIGEARLNQIIR